MTTLRGPCSLPAGHSGDCRWSDPLNTLDVPMYSDNELRKAAAHAAAAERASILRLVDWWAADYAKYPEDYSQAAARALTELAKLLRDGAPALLTSAPEMHAARERQAEQGSVDLAGDTP